MNKQTLTGQWSDTFISDIKYRYVEWKEKANVTMSVRDFSKKFNDRLKEKRYQSNGKYAFHDIKLDESVTK